MAGTASPPFDRERLARFLAAASGADSVKIAGLELLPGGAIQQNWGIDAAFAGGSFDGRQRLVLRTDAATGIAASLSRIQEFAVLRAAHAAGAAVPQPLFACDDPAVLGKPFFVMRRLAGTAHGRHITADPALEPHLPAVAARLGRELALIQTIRPPRADLACLTTTGPSEHIAAFRAYLDGHPQKRPVLEWAIRWLETHLPEPLPPVLCHRDFRTGNYMLDRAELAGILDWEFAGWGDPDEDIGWFCCKGWRFARLDREAGGIADRAPFYAGYESAAGRCLDPARVLFWEVLANVRWAVIALQQSDRHLLGGAQDLSTAIIGRRAGECELELLILLYPGAAPKMTLAPPVGERVGARGQTAAPIPSPVRGLTPAATLSRNAGEGQMLRDRPDGMGLLALGRDLLHELVPLVPPERQRELHLLATAIGIAGREAAAGDVPEREIAEQLAAFFAPHPGPLPARGEREKSSDAAAKSLAPRSGEREGPIAERWEGEGLPGLLARFAAELRAGAFEPCEKREAAARAILWRLAMVRLREGNPGFLALHGFGE